MHDRKPKGQTPHHTSYTALHMVGNTCVSGQQSKYFKLDNLGSPRHHKSSDSCAPHLRLGRHGGEDVVHQLRAHVPGGVPQQRALAHRRRAHEQLGRGAQESLIGMYAGLLNLITARLGTAT